MRNVQLFHVRLKNVNSDTWSLRVGTERERSTIKNKRNAEDNCATWETKEKSWACFAMTYWTFIGEIQEHSIKIRVEFNYRRDYNNYRELLNAFFFNSLQE
jgi:hypothetical protein